MVVFLSSHICVPAPFPKGEAIIQSLPKIFIHEKNFTKYLVGFIDPYGGLPAWKRLWTKQPGCHH